MKKESYLIVCFKYGYAKTILRKKSFRFFNETYRSFTIDDAIKKTMELKKSGEWDDVILYKIREVFDEIHIFGTR